MFSFVKSFNASLKGCVSPFIPTFFGPVRKCLIPIIFRSIRVKRATATRIGTSRICYIHFKELPIYGS